MLLFIECNSIRKCIKYDIISNTMYISGRSRVETESL